MLGNEELAASVGGVASIIGGIIVYLWKFLPKTINQPGRSPEDAEPIDRVLLADLQRRIVVLEGRQKTLVEIVSSIYQEAKFLAESGLLLADSAGVAPDSKEMTKRNIEASLARIGRTKLNNPEFFQ